jgi:Rab GDP dissociation inhibitor
VSAEAETDNPQSELKPGIDLLGPVDELFFDMYDRYEPVNEPSLDNCFVSSVSFALYENTVLVSYCRCSWQFFFLPSLQSYDATTHFETTVTDVLNMYTLITGKVSLRFAPFTFAMLAGDY